MAVLGRVRWRQDWLLDALLAASLTAVTLASLLTSDPSIAYEQPDPNAWLVLLALTAGLSLSVRRRWPTAVLAVTMACNTAIEWHGWDPDLVGVCLLVALYTVAAWRSPKISVACVVLLYATQGMVFLVRHPPSYEGGSPPEALIFVVVWLLGWYVRHARQGRQTATARALEAERTRTVAAERAVFSERLRLARELHDVITHTLSVIAVQSAVARHLLESRPQQARPALEAIEEAGRAALDDLRRMLTVLRESPSAEEQAPHRARQDAWAPSHWLLDLVIGLALTAVTVSSVLTSDPTDAYTYPEPNLWLVLLALAGALPLTVRRRWPEVVFALTLAATVAVAGLKWNVGALPFCLMLALYTVSTWRVRTAAVGALCTVYLGMSLLALVRAPYYDHPLALVSVLAFTVVWAIGRYVRHQRERHAGAVEAAVEAERHRTLAAERAVFAERLRIARELHDVVSHTLSVIAVQAGVAGHLLDTQPERAAPALEAIEEAGRTALEDLRRMLGVLDAEPDASLAPTPGLDELELLASAHRASYGPIQLSVEGPVDQAPQSLRTTVYRIVQEGLTNARKHAPGAPVRVSVRTAGDNVIVQIQDDGPGQGATSEGGYGLAGMRERVAMFGGSLTAGPRPGGGFQVRAALRVGREHAEATP